MTDPVEQVAEAIRREAKTVVYRESLDWKKLAQAAIDALQRDGAALVDRETLDALTACYGGEFVDGLRNMKLR